MNSNKSAVYAEKVVNPPRKPTLIISLISSEMFVVICKKAIDKPMKKPPNRLTTKLPNGIPGNIASIPAPINHRIHAPIAAEKPIRKKLSIAKF